MLLGLGLNLNKGGFVSSPYYSVLASAFRSRVQSDGGQVGNMSCLKSDLKELNPTKPSAFTGLLNDYSGAAAAYSLRLLDNTYTGDAVLVRRASDNTTQAIGFVNNELDTTSLESFCSGTDGFVTTWYDQSGNGNDATSVFGAFQPKIVSSGSTITDNGKPILQDGISMNINASITTSGLTQLAVAKNLSTGNRNIMNYYYTTSNKYILAASNGDSSSGVFGIGPQITKLNGSDFSYSTRDFTWDNTLNQSLISFNYNQSDVTGLNALVVGWSSSSWGMWDMQEFIVYPTNQSSNISDIETNINDHYSIY